MGPLCFLEDSLNFDEDSLSFLKFTLSFLGDPRGNSEKTKRKFGVFPNPLKVFARFSQFVSRFFAVFWVF